MSDLLRCVRHISPIRYTQLRRMDNKPLEGRAENETSKQLTKLGLFVCKPYFDVSGSDLLIEVI